MRRRTLVALTMAAVLGILIGLAGAASGQGPAQLTRTDNGGGITVKAVYLTASYLKDSPRDPLIGKVELDRTIVFGITLDAHSGDLSTYDFVKNAVLRNDRGQQVAGLRWVATADGSHHRAGGLVFPKADRAGRSLDADARTLELVVRGLGGVPERVLRWTLPLP